MRRLLLILFVLSLGFTSSTFAQNQCVTCGSPAKVFSDYTEFVNKVLWAIQTVGSDGAGLWRNTVPWLFQSQILEFPTQEQNAIQRWVQRTTRAMNQAAQASLATSYVLLSDAVDMVWFDGFLGLAILFQGEAIVRDRSTLQKLDNKIQDKNFALWAAAWWLQEIAASDRVQIEKHFADAKTDKILSGFVIAPEATYADLLNALKAANNMMKWFLSLNSITALSREIPAPVDGEHALVRIKFNVDSLNTMKQQYICSRAWDKCAGNLKWFADSIKNLSKENIAGAKNAINTMERSVFDLMNAFGAKWGKVYNKLKVKYDTKESLSKEDQLLRALYGSDYKRIQDGQGLGVQDIWQLLKWEPVRVDNQWSISNPFADLSKKDYGASQKETMEYQTISEATNTSITDLALQSEAIDKAIIAKKANAAYKEALRDRFLAVNIDVGEMIAANDGLVQENYDVTLYIPKLALQLQGIRDVIGTKDTQGMLLYNLGKSCELQCQNKGGTCWY